MSFLIRLLKSLLVASCLVILLSCGDEDGDSEADTGAPDKDASVKSDGSMDSGSGEAGGEETGGTGGGTGGTGGGSGGTGGGSGGSGGGAGGTASECTMLVGAECDGDEDCSGDEVCCGAYTGTGYSSIDCQLECTSVRLCHYGESCEAEDGTTYDCASSGILPASLGVCVATLSPSTEASKSAVAGEINCGDSICGEGEKCCLRGASKDPYCTDKENECLCDYVPGEDDAGA